MNHLNDDQLDATLRRFFVSEADFIESEALSPLEMADRLNVKTSVPWDRRFMVLLAAALLLAGLVATAILGSGPVRELTRVDHTVPRLIAAGACPSGLPEELLLTATKQDGTGEFPWSTITLYSDGQLLSRPASGTPTVRRLSPEGIQRVVERASAVNVEGNCRSIYAAGPYGSLYVATSDGFLSLSWGGESRPVHATTPGETAAVDELSDWLDGLDGWLLEDWVVTATQPYVAEKWSVDIQRVFGGDGDAAGPDPAAFTFPDGTTLSTFGVPLPIPDPEDPVATIERCGIVSAEVAAQMTSSLDSIGAPSPGGFGGGWLFSEEAGSGHDVIVQMNPLDHFSPGCLEGLDRTPTPSASPDPLASFDPCSVVPKETVSDILGRVVEGEAHLSYLPGGMRDCVYFGGGQEGTLLLSIRRLTTSTADGRELARELFGSGLSEKEVDGARIYSNGCSEAAAACEPAIAISVAPYFAVVSGADPQDASQEAALETLAAAVIDNLAAR